MKKLIFGLIATVMFGMGAQAQTLGAEHNRFLNYLYEACKDKCKVDPMFLKDKEKVAVLLHFKSVEFFKNSALITDKSNLDERTAELILAAFGSDSFNISSYNYSTKQQKHIGDILKVFDDKLNLEQTIKQFNKIDNNAKNDLNATEYSAIHSIIDLAINSSTYAFNNMDKWQNLPGNTHPITTDWLDFIAIASADAKGFIKGLFLGHPLEKAAIDSFVEIIKQFFFN